MRYSVSDKAPTPPPAPSDEPKEPLPSPLSTPKPDQKTPNFNKPKTDTVIDDTISTKEDLEAKVDDNDEQHDDSDSEGELHIDMGSQECTIIFTKICFYNTYLLLPSIFLLVF